MLLFTSSDPIAVQNHVQATFQDTWRHRHEVVFGVSNVKQRTGHFFVFDSPLVKDALTIDVEHIDVGGSINWNRVDKYMRAKPTTVPDFRIKPQRIATALNAAKDDTEHTLSALASHARSDQRPAIVREIVKFLTDSKAKRFTLPKSLEPQRGKNRTIYDRACEADFAKLKRAISEGSEHFEATYWRVVIARTSESMQK